MIVQPGSVKRVGERADHPARGTGGKLGVAVEGDQEPDASEAFAVPRVHQGRIRLRPGAGKEPVQFLQLPAFPFPADIPLFGGRPPPPAVEQEESILRVAMVKCVDVLHRGLKQFRVPVLLGRIRILKIREQAEKHVRILIGQVTDFQFFRFRPDGPGIRQQNRHDHQSPERIGDAGLLKIHFRQRAGRKHAGQDVIQHLDGGLAEGQHKQDREHKPYGETLPGLTEEKQRQEKRGEGEGEACEENGRGTGVHLPAEEVPDRLAAPQSADEFAPSFGD